MVFMLNFFYTIRPKGTALHLAIYKGNKDIIRIFLENQKTNLIPIE